MMSQSLRILLVDDEALVRSNVKYELERLDVATQLVGESENGEAALSLYYKMMPDIIITDVRMPHMDGLQLIEAIRRIDNRTQFIIISGFAEFSYAQQAMRLGVYHYVLKPVKMTDLALAVKQCLLMLYPDRIDELPESEQLITYLDKHFNEVHNLEELSERFNFSPKYISSLIKGKVGLSFTDYLTQLRMRRASQLLRQTTLDVGHIAEMVGYDDQQYFHRVFKKTTGMTPLSYRKLNSYRSD